MSLAAATREAVRADPVLYDALRAGIVNYTAAADSLPVDGDREAIATALRRFAAALDARETESRSVTVRLHSDIESVAVDTLVAVDGTGIMVANEAVDAGEIGTDGRTALRVTGEVDARLLSTTLDRLRIAAVPVAAAGLISKALVLVVSRRDGPTAVELIEALAESGY